MSKKKPSEALVRQRAMLTAGMPVAARQWVRLIEARLGLPGLSSSNAIPLMVLGRMPEGTNQAALADQIGVARPSVIRHIDSLCEHGLVVREPDAIDRRAKRLMLTPEGKRLAAELEIRLESLRKDVYGGLDEGDIAAALRVQDAVARASLDIAAPGDKTSHE